MDNKITENCKGCDFKRALSLHGGDMPTTFVCENTRTCLYLSYYSKPEKTLEELKKELIETVKTANKLLKSIDVLKS